MDPEIENFAKRCAEENAARIPALLEAKFKLINGMIVGEKFPEGASEVITPPSEELVLHAAKTELRRVAMFLHATARQICANQFETPADVSDAMDLFYVAYHAIENSLRSQTIINALNLTKK